MTNVAQKIRLDPNAPVWWPSHYTLTPLHIGIDSYEHAHAFTAPAPTPLSPLSRSTAQPASEAEAAWHTPAQAWLNRSELQRVRHALYITNELGARKLYPLEVRRITHVVLCGAEPEPLFPHLFTYLTLHGLKDTAATDLEPHLINVVGFAADALARGGRVLFVCSDGGSRSGAMLVACLMALRHLTFLEALSAVRKARPLVQLNAGFVEQLSDERLYHALQQYGEVTAAAASRSRRR